MPNFYNLLRARKFSTAADTAIEIGPHNSATPNFVVEAGGKLKWSSGSASADTTLYRSAANTLKTDDSFDVASGHTYKIDGADVVTATSLGSGITHSHLTSVGSLTSLSAATPSFSGPLTSSGEAEFNSETTFNSQTTFNSMAVFEAELVAATPSFVGPFSSSGDSIFYGRVDFEGIRETVSSISASADLVTCNYTNACVFYLANSTGITKNYTVDVINVPTDDGYAMTISIIVNQGNPGYYPGVFKINGTTQDVKWVNDTAPSTSASKIDIYNFTLIRISGSWVVLGGASNNYDLI